MWLKESLLIITVLFSISIFSQDADTSFDRALELREKGQYSDAIFLLKNTTNPPLKNIALLGKIYMDSGDIQKALYYYNASCPGLNTDTCFNEWGVALMSAEHYKNAWAAFEKAIALNPDESRYYANIGLSYFYMSKREKALEFYHRALKIDPANYTALINLGILLIYDKKYTDASSYLKKAIEVNPDHYYGYLYMGYLLYRKKEYKESLAFYNQGIDIYDKSALLYLYRANLYYTEGNLSGAQEDLDRASSLDPNNYKIKILQNAIDKRRGY